MMKIKREVKKKKKKKKERMIYGYAILVVLEHALVHIHLSVFGVHSLHRFLDCHITYIKN
jgi:hypothetical protein